MRCRRLLKLSGALLIFLLAGRLQLCSAAGDEQENEGSSNPLDFFVRKQPKVQDATQDPELSVNKTGAADDKPKETIAQIIDEALKEEFKHEEQNKAGVGEKFNESRSSNEGKQETVIIISQKKTAVNQTATDADDASAAATAAATADGYGNSTVNATTESKPKMDMNVESDVDRIIDSHDNEYVLSKPNEEGSMGLTLDPQLIRDLAVLIAVSAVAGLVMESLGQPTINGYFIAGSLIGPGGLKWIKEIVQVQSVAQLGVQLLLFTLGLEFDLGKVKAVRDVALWGGLIEIVLMAALGGAGATVIGVGAYPGSFVGAVLAMSSTSIVIKCLQESRAAHQPHAQITIGTLILQDCVVGLLFAFMPVLAGAAGGKGGAQLWALGAVAGRVLLTLAATAAAATLIARTVLPRATRALHRFSPESFAMSVLGLCMCAAMATTRLGISAELGAFIAGVALSATEQQEAVAHAAEPLARFFLALFIASTGLTISPTFMVEHLPILAAGVMVLIIAKSLLIAGVVLAFRRPLDTALAVGISLAQIGEFGFVLLSMANQQGLVGSQVYLLLMGTTALSLLLTPFLLQVSIRLIPKHAAPGSDVELATLVKRRMSPAVRPPGAAPHQQHASGAGDAAYDEEAAVAPAALGRQAPHRRLVTESRSNSCEA